MDANVSLFDRFISRIAFIPKWGAKGINYWLIAYPIIKNWHEFILFRAAFIKEPKLRLRENMMLPFFFPILTKNFGYCKRMIEGNKIVFTYKRKKVRMFYDTQRQLINSLEVIKDQFIGEEYGMLEFEGKEVVDIGANVGDTAIYFALNGAKHIYAFEPYPYSYGVAQKNMKLNGIEGKVTLLNEGCSGKKGKILLDARFKNDERSPLIKFPKGRAVQITTLFDIAQRYGLHDAVLKVDCEGEEYDLILNAQDGVLRKFDQIVIEYHYGFRNLENKLRGAGFSVRHQMPSYGENPTPGKIGMHYGLIFATRQD